MSWLEIFEFEQYTAPRLACLAALKMTKLKLDLSTDINMLLIGEKGIRGASKHSSWRHLEDVFHLAFPNTSSRHLQNVLTETIIFTLGIRIQKTSSRGVQDVLIMTNIFALLMPLQDAFKTFSRRFSDV